MGSETTWTCKDGRVLKVSEMETEHLRNAINMLRRNGFVTIDDFWGACSAAASLGGEMAQMAAEQEIAGMQISGKLDALEEEMARREAAR